LNILIIALSGIGDALMFTPALRKLAEFYPGSQIDCLAMFKGVQNIFEHQPEINSVHFHNFIEEKPLKSLLFVLKLRKKYNISINVYPSNRKEYNIINFLLGAKQRAAVKYLRRDSREVGFLNNVRVDENDNMHNVEENIRLVEKLAGKKVDTIPPLSFLLNDDDELAAEVFFVNNNIQPDDLVIGFHPGCAMLKNHIHRRWEPEKFAALGRRLIKEQNAKILIFGGPDENELKNLVHEGIASERAFKINMNSLSKSAAVMNRCSVFVTNDSSLMHTAAALQLKTVAIIGPTNTNYIHPWKTEHKIVSLNLDCSPCFYYSPKPLECKRKDVEFKCIRELSVELVYEKTVQFLDTTDNLNYFI